MDNRKVSSRVSFNAIYVDKRKFGHEIDLQFFFFLDHLLYFIVSNSGCKLRCQEKTHCWEADDTGESAPTEGQL